MNTPAPVVLPELDAADIKLINKTKKILFGNTKTVPQAITTIAMVEIIHQIADHPNCPSAYRVLVAPLLRKLADDIDEIEAKRPKIVHA
jgi:hypothetical protein